MPSELVERAHKAQGIIGDLARVLEAQDAEIERLGRELADAAREINCAGTVAHRIRVMKQTFNEGRRATDKRVGLMEDELERLRGLAICQRCGGPKLVVEHAERFERENRALRAVQKAATRACDAWANNAEGLLEEMRRLDRALCALDESNTPDGE